uniref:Uncharacterized protein n=1 Tax=viral metagenome TaxID=1070528 RepID=A0A6C0I2M0_9ZZZZ
MLSIFPLSEYYNIGEETCQIKDVIISQDSVIIRTTNVVIKNEGLFQKGLDRTQKPPKAILKRRKKAYFLISGEKYKLETPVFEFFQTRGRFNGNRMVAEVMRQYHINILTSVGYFAANGWDVFYDTIYDFNQITKIQNIECIFDLNLAAVVDCGTFESHYSINKDDTLYKLYKEYKRIYDTIQQLKDMHEIEYDAYAVTIEELTKKCLELETNIPTLDKLYQNKIKILEEDMQQLINMHKIETNTYGITIEELQKKCDDLTMSNAELQEANATLQERTKILDESHF